MTAVLLLVPDRVPGRSGPAGDDAAGPRESWFRLEWNGSPVGWTKETEPGDLSRTGTACWQTETALRMARLGQEVSIWNRTRFVPDREIGSGLLLYELSTAPRETLRIACRFDADSLRIRKSMGGRESVSSLSRPDALLTPDVAFDPWSASSCDSTARSSFATYVPELEAVLNWTATCEGPVAADTSGRFPPLRRWRLQVDGWPALRSIEWRDSVGQLWRSEDVSGVTAIRCAPHDVDQDGPVPEMMGPTLVRLDRKFEARRRYSRAVYEIRTPPGTPPLEPAETPAVRILLRTEDAAGSLLRVAVEALPTPPSDAASGGAGGSLQPAEREKALRPTLLVEADDPRIRRAAASVVGTESDPWRQAEALRLFVSSRVRIKSLRVLFASAARTLEAGEGDCTEHALLLAALARAAGLPARVAAGLVGVGDRMGYHLWTEVFVDGAWIGIDAAQERAPVDARYLPLAVTDLADDSMAALALGLLSGIGQIQIRVLEATGGAFETEGENE